MESINDIKIKPYISDDCLIVPAGCDKKYKYWEGGQSVAETLYELVATHLILDKYVNTKKEVW
jgi:hypothetical protein